MSVVRVIINKYGIYFLSFAFFLAYSTLSLVRHNHYLSAYDLAVVDQIMWRYSNFMTPVTTVHAYSGTLIFSDHIELIYALLSPLYWIWNDARALITAQAFFISVSVIPIYLLSKKYSLNEFLNLCICVSYLAFYGIQTAVWNDVHSIVFGASFLVWFIYFLDVKRMKLSFLFFLLAIFSKEDVAFLTFAVSLIYFILRRDKYSLAFISGSIAYLFIVFFVYYPHFTTGYRFEHANGFFGEVSLANYFDTADKKQTLFYSIAWFGFLPIFAPLYLLGALADVTHYFILGSTVTTAQGIFLHYRVTLAALLALPTIIFFSKYKKLNKWYMGFYLLIFALGITYYLHLPLTYLSKSWFWTTPQGINSINKLVGELPSNSSVVSEVNITSHMAHRSQIYTLWAETKKFSGNSPCGRKDCSWFRWDGKPEYLIADTGSNWDIRQLFQNNDDFNLALSSIEKEGIVKLYRQEGTAKLFKVLRNPKEI